MKGRNPTAEERHWLNRISGIGCIVCTIFYEKETPPAIHHIDGKTKPNAHLSTIPLCVRHHQHKDNHKPKRWVSRHGDGRYEFEEAYGSEYYLLDEVKLRI